MKELPKMKIEDIKTCFIPPKKARGLYTSTIYNLVAEVRMRQVEDSKKITFLEPTSARKLYWAFTKEVQRANLKDIGLSISGNVVYVYRMEVPK